MNVNALINAPINTVPTLVIPIDWQRVRVDAAIAAMQGLLANPDICDSMVAQLAVWHADKLIAELQKEVVK